MSTGHGTKKKDKQFVDIYFSNMDENESSDKLEQTKYMIRLDFI